MLAKNFNIIVLCLACSLAASAKELTIAQMQEAVGSVLKVNYSDKLSAKQIKALAKSVDKSFLQGKWIEKYDFKISLMEYIDPFISFRIVDNIPAVSGLQMYGFDEPHFQFAIRRGHGNFEAISARPPPKEGYEERFLMINQYRITDITGDQTPEAILLFSDLSNGIILTVRVIAIRNEKVHDSYLNTPLVPVGKPTVIEKEKCPGTQYMDRNLLELKIRECEAFSIKKVTHYWNCPLPDIETFTFDCKNLRITPRPNATP